jgi:hypothetical protein
MSLDELQVGSAPTRNFLRLVIAVENEIDRGASRLPGLVIRIFDESNQST